MTKELDRAVATHAFACRAALKLPECQVGKRLAYALLAATEWIYCAAGPIPSEKSELWATSAAG